MADAYGSDYISIEDEDGTRFELEVLTTLEFNGNTYLAVMSADDSHPELDPMEVSILKSTEDNGEPILSIIEDPQELETVYNLIIDSLYEEPESD